MNNYIFFFFFLKQPNSMSTKFCQLKKEKHRTEVEVLFNSISFPNACDYIVLYKEIYANIILNNPLCHFTFYYT